jgi:hypothetical protein
VAIAVDSLLRQKKTSLHRHKLSTRSFLLFLEYHCEAHLPICALQVPAVESGVLRHECSARPPPAHRGWWLVQVQAPRRWVSRFVPVLGMRFGNLKTAAVNSLSTNYEERPAAGRRQQRRQAAGGRRQHVCGPGRGARGSGAAYRQHVCYYVHQRKPTLDRQNDQIEA